jgi:hypothetical protein
MQLEPEHMHACGAVEHSRVHGTLRGTPVPGVGQGSACVALSVHGRASPLQVRALERSNSLGSLSSNTHQNTTNGRTITIITNPFPPMDLIRNPQNIAIPLLLTREGLTKTYSDVF